MNKYNCVALSNNCKLKGFPRSPFLFFTFLLVFKIVYIQKEEKKTGTSDKRKMSTNSNNTEESLVGCTDLKFKDSVSGYGGFQQT